MKLSRILIAATGAELSFASGLIGILGLCGFWSPALDAFNHLAAVWLAAGLIGGGLSWLALPEEGGRRLVLTLAALGVLANSVQMVPDLSIAALRLVPPKAAGTSLKVLHYNVWIENFDTAGTADQILASGADVVMLQEGFGPFSKEFKRMKTVYPYRAACKEIWVCGQIIFSKRPLLAWGALVPKPPLQPDALGVVWVRIRAPDGKPVTLVTTHFNWPLPPAQQAVQRAKLVRYLATLPNKDDLILSGDMNSAPWSFALRRLDKSLKPLDRRTRALFSWPANFARMRKPFPVPLMPIDHIYADPHWRTLKVERLPRAGSDHYGVMATFSRE